jgi:cardiolipin synthase
MPNRRIIPNLITLARLVSVPIITWAIISNEVELAFWLFMAAGVSDGIDGFIAKHLNAETELGKFLDPVADKVLLVATYIALGYTGTLATWLVILVVSRDLIIVGGALLYETVTHSLEMTPITISKVNTVAQIILATYVLGANGLAIHGYLSCGGCPYNVTLR